jgi:ABC-type Mn2+/Zn2+ transport system permease subunit
MMIVGALICCFSGVTGIFLAWHLGVSPSAAIVLTMTVLFFVAYFFAPERGLVWSRWRRQIVPDAVPGPEHGHVH